MVPQPVRDQIGKRAGQTVRLELEVDPKPPTIRVPPDFRRSLGAAAPRFQQLAPSHRKAFVAWIEEAKRPETRERRIREAVQMVREGRNRN